MPILGSPAVTKIYLSGVAGEVYCGDGAWRVGLLPGSDHGLLTGLTDDDHTQYIKHALATAANDFLVSSGAGVFVKQTLAEVKTTLGLGSAAYTASTAYEAAGAIAAHAALITGVHGLVITAGKTLTVQDNVTITGALGTAAYTAATSYLAAGGTAVDSAKLGGALPAAYALVGQTMYIGSTAVAINRGTGALALTGITSIDGSAASCSGNAATVTGLSVTAGKTLTVSNSLTLTATDGSTLAIGTGGTLGTAAYTVSTSYALLAGRAGGQTLYGGDAANDDLTLAGTSHATVTSSYILAQSKTGINCSAPGAWLEVDVATASASGAIVKTTDDNNTNLLQSWQSSAGAVLVGVRILGTGSANLQFNGSLAFNYQNTTEIGRFSSTGFMVGTTALGTSAAKVVGIGSGTAPSSAPADITQLWAADVNGAAGYCGLHKKTETTNATEIVPGVVIKGTTGQTANPYEGLFEINTYDNTFKVYADAGWRSLATW